MLFQNLFKYILQNIIIFSALLFSGLFNNFIKVELSLLGFLILIIFSLLLRFLSQNSSKAKGFWINAIAYLLLGISLLAAAFILNLSFGFLCLVIIVLRIAHILWLESIPLVDDTILPIEIALKGAAGAAIINVPQSGWGLVSIFLLALLVSLGRKKNKMKFSSDGHLMEQYNQKLLNEMMGVVSSSTILAYCLFSIAPETVHHIGNQGILYSIPFVLYGIFRYIWLINMVDINGEVEVLIYRDYPMGITVVGWLSSVIVVFLLGN